MTDRPVLEAVGEVLRDQLKAIGEAISLIEQFAAFADEAEREANKHGCSPEVWGKRCPWELLERSREVRALLSPTPIVNAGEERITGGITFGSPSNKTTRTGV